MRIWAVVAVCALMAGCTLAGPDQLDVIDVPARPIDGTGDGYGDIAGCACCRGYTQGGQAGKRNAQRKNSDDVICMPSLNAMAKEE